MDVGTDLDPDLVRITMGWGAQYRGSENEVKNKILVLQKEIKRLESMLNG